MGREVGFGWLVRWVWLVGCEVGRVGGLAGWREERGERREGKAGR
jgi:hypothetical protein